MIAFSILVLAVVLWWCGLWLSRIAKVIGAFGHVIEKNLNHAAELRGEPPITTAADAEHFH